VAIPLKATRNSFLSFLSTSPFFRTGVFVKVALIHLAEAHYIWGNYPGTAMRMFLPPKHPVRRAFTAHFFKTAYTCDRAKYSLFAAKGILSRGLSWKYKGGLEQSFIDLIEGFEFSTWPDELKAKGVDKCKFHVGANDGVELHTVLSDYVSDRLDHVYASQKELDDDVHMKDFWDFIKAKMPGVPEALTLDNLKMFWGEVLFRVTGWHESSKYYFCWMNAIFSGAHIFVLTCSVVSLMFDIMCHYSWTGHSMGS
jgi:hypothetical protein